MNIAAYSYSFLPGLFEQLRLLFEVKLYKSSVCMDKDIAKRLLQAAGINVANGSVYRKNEQQEINYETVAEQLGTPMFIKPANQGSSVGISKVTTEEEFRKTFTDILGQTNGVITNIANSSSVKWKRQIKFHLRKGLL